MTKGETMDSYTVVIEPDEDAYHAFVPALPGCHTFGETVDEALLFIKEAIALYIEGHGSKTGKFALHFETTTDRRNKRMRSTDNIRLFLKSAVVLQR
jgi:predicted RNase H-like HicB family nuclease